MYDILQSHGIQLASNQVEYSLLRTQPEDSGLFAAMKERGIALLACKYSQEPFTYATLTIQNLDRLAPGSRPPHREVLRRKPATLRSSILQHAHGTT
jgi:hypothetical protein